MYRIFLFFYTITQNNYNINYIIVVHKIQVNEHQCRTFNQALQLQQVATVKRTITMFT